MSIILDQGQDPGANAAISAAQGFGAAGWMVYVGGRSLFFAPWSNTTIQGILQAGLGVLPVYALAGPLTQAQGIGDGATTAQLVAAAGIAISSLVMLDVEPSFYNANPGGTLDYANAWQDTVQAAGYKSCMYGLANFIDAFQSTPPSADAVIVAGYPHPLQIWGPPTIDQIPSALNTWPAWRGWQYTNEVMVGGLTVDLSVINFPLAGGDDMFEQSDRDKLNDLWNAHKFGHGTNTPPEDYWLWGISDGKVGGSKIDEGFAAVLAAVKAIPGGNNQPVLDAIAALKAELDAVKTKTDKDLA